MEQDNMFRARDIIQIIESLGRVKPGDKVEIQSTIAYRKHGQHSYKGEIGRK